MLLWWVNDRYVEVLWETCTLITTANILAWDEEHHHLQLLPGHIVALHSLSPQSNIANILRYSLLVNQKDNK